MISNMILKFLLLLSLLLLLGVQSQVPVSELHEETTCFLVLTVCWFHICLPPPRSSSVLARHVVYDFLALVVGVLVLRTPPASRSSMIASSGSLLAS
jgi:hypothetical protein